MRTAISIKRYHTSCGSYIIGARAAEILTAIAGISAVRVDTQHIDSATLSYVTDGAAEQLDRIDFMLGSAGLRRV